MGPSELATYQNFVSHSVTLPASHGAGLGTISSDRDERAKQRFTDAGFGAPLSSRDPRLITRAPVSVLAKDTAMGAQSKASVFLHQRLKSPPKRSFNSDEQPCQVGGGKQEQSQSAGLDLDSSTGSQEATTMLTLTSDDSDFSEDKTPFAGVNVPITLIPGKMAWPSADSSQSAGSFNKGSVSEDERGRIIDRHMENALLRRILSSGTHMQQRAQASNAEPEEAVSCCLDAPGLLLLADIANQGGLQMPESSSAEAQREGGRPQRQCKQSVRRSSLSPERKAREPQSTRLPRQAKEPGQPPNTLKPQSRVQQLVDGICRAKEASQVLQDQLVCEGEGGPLAAGLPPLQAARLRLERQRRSRSAKEAILNAPQWMEVGGYTCPICSTMKTPLWRWDEERLVCNACGLRKQQASSKRRGGAKAGTEQAVPHRLPAHRDRQAKLGRHMNERLSPKHALMSLTNKASFDAPIEASWMLQKQPYGTAFLDSAQYHMPESLGPGPSLVWGKKRKRSNV